MDRCTLRHGVRSAARLLVPFAGPPKVNTGAINDDGDRLTSSQARRKLLAALPHTQIKRGELIAQMTEAGHGYVQPTRRPELLREAGDLTHAKAQQPVERGHLHRAPDTRPP